MFHQNRKVFTKNQFILDSEETFSKQAFHKGFHHKKNKNGLLLAT